MNDLDDFKPVSVDTAKEATIEFGQGNQVTVTAPNTDGSGFSESVFTGSRKPHLKECVLIIDHDTGQITIERLSQQITVKQTRVESGKGQTGSSIHRPSTPVSDSGSMAGNRKHSPSASGQNNFHSSNNKSTGGKSPRTSVSPSTPNSSLSSHSSQNNNRVAKCSPNLSSPAILTSHSDDVSILSESSSDDDDDGARSSAGYPAAANGVSKSPIHSNRFNKSSDVMSSSSSSSSDDDDDDHDDHAGQKVNGFTGMNGTLPSTPSDVKMMSSDAESSADNDDQQEESEEEGEIRQRNRPVNGKSGITSSSCKRNDASAQNNSATLLSMPQFSQLSEFPYPCPASQFPHHLIPADDDLCLSESGSDSD